MGLERTTRSIVGVLGWMSRGRVGWGRVQWSGGGHRQGIVEQRVGGEVVKQAGSVRA